MLYAVTNANEGLLYVDANIADTAVVADYLTQLYPKLSDSSVQAGAALYAHASLGSAFD